MGLIPNTDWSLGETIQATIWSIKALFGDQDAKAHLEALDEVNSQRTPVDVDIYDRTEYSSDEFTHVGLWGILDSVGDSTRGIFKGFGGIVKGVFNGIEFVFKRFWVIIIALIVLVGAWYLINLKKAVGK